MSFRTRCYIKEKEKVCSEDERWEKKKEEQWKEVSQLWLKSWERWKCSVSFDS